jgi:beta-glucanase (GH16 family)
MGDSLSLVKRVYIATLAVLAVVLTVALVVKFYPGNRPAKPTAKPSATSTAKQIVQVQPQTLSRNGWKVAFRDEFNGKTLNRKLWNTCWPTKPANTCKNSGEQQWYRPANVSLSHGLLRLTVKRQRILAKGWLGCCKYTSGMITTFGRRSFRYGLYEARINYPPGPGLWTSFWLSAADYSWPPEIDDAEHRGAEPHTITNAYHYNLWPNGRKTGSTANLSKNMPHNMERGWHTYDVTWEPNVIKWYVDDKQVNVFRRCRAGVRPVTDSRTCGPIATKPMALLMTFAVGDGSRTWLSGPTKATRFPRTVLVDYIRVYKQGR